MQEALIIARSIPSSGHGGGMARLTVVGQGKKRWKSRSIANIDV